MIACLRFYLDWNLANDRLSEIAYGYRVTSDLPGRSEGRTFSTGSPLTIRRRGNGRAGWASGLV